MLKTGSSDWWVAWRSATRNEINSPRWVLLPQLSTTLGTPSADRFDTATSYRDVRHEILQLPQHDGLHVDDVHARCVHDARLSHDCPFGDVLQLPYGDELRARDVRQL